MITPSFALTATERVLPRLALDFTTASLDPRVTFTRTGNTATVVNSSGYVASINADLPRFDYNPVTLVCKGLLIEEARTNSLTYSADFSNAAWVKQALNTTGTPPYVDVATAPDNTLSADKVITDATTNAHGIYQNVTTVVGTTYTFSIFGKASEYPFLRISENAFSTFAAVFNLNTKQVTRTAGAAYVSSRITDFGNGWCRCEVTWTATQTLARPATIGLLFDTVATAGPSFVAGNNSDGIFIWGAQSEVGAFATSYIPTTTTALTRNADVATMTGTNFSDWYNASEGTLYADGIAVNRTANYTAVIAELAGSAGNNLIELYGLTNARGQAFVTDNAGAVTANPLILNGFPLGAQGKIAFAYKVNDFALSCNGATVSADVSGALPTGQSTLQIGRYNGGSAYWNSTIGKIMYWPQRLTNAEVQAFSK